MAELLTCLKMSLLLRDTKHPHIVNMFTMWEYNNLKGIYMSNIFIPQANSRIFRLSTFKLDYFWDTFLYYQRGN